MKKRKNYKVGFIVQSAVCNVCQFDARTNKDFYELKEDLIYEIQDKHEAFKPTASEEIADCL